MSRTEPAASPVTIVKYGVVYLLSCKYTAGIYFWYWAAANVAVNEDLVLPIMAQQATSQ
jgi:hypothetical protein